MRVTVHVRRQRSSDSEPYEAVYEVDAPQGSTVLDVLRIISRTDPGLAYTSHHCKLGVCGGCTMLINGRGGLACRTFVDGPELHLAPAPGLPVIKDILVDLLATGARGAKAGRGQQTS